MAAMVELKELRKRFGPITAVDGVSFQVDKGEVLGFLGPNGAGKSTTMKMLTCFLAPTSGTASVCGFDILEKPTQVRSRIGYLPEGAPAYPDMTPTSFLNFIAEIRGLKGSSKKKAIDRVWELVDLKGVMHQPIETLSKGYKRRVGLAQAILADPDVLILDEPTDGLDPNQKHEVRTLIKEMSKDKVIILSTHILEEVEAVCSRAIIIAKGRSIFDGTPAELERRSRYHNAVSLTIEKGTAPEAKGKLSALDNVDKVEERGSGENGTVSFMVFPKKGKAILAEISAFALKNGWQLDELHSEVGRLDEVFRQLTLGGSKKEDRK
ncbi:ABC transporter ATP-binding protein [bacterium]|nr:ABC transporter ATP-binding protein [bacterium]